MCVASVNVVYFVVILCLFQNARVHVLDTEPFDHTFGPKAQRRHPNLKVADIEVSTLGSAHTCTHTHTHTHLLPPPPPPPPPPQLALWDIG